MCGIMGYVGPQEAAPIIMDGLKRLEYRGYDSAGIAISDGSIRVSKAEGKIVNLEVLLEAEPLAGSSRTSRISRMNSPLTGPSSHPRRIRSCSLILWHASTTAIWPMLSARPLRSPKGHTRWS